MRTREKQQAVLAGILLMFCILAGFGTATLRIRRDTERLRRLRSQRTELESLRQRISREREWLQTLAPPGSSVSLEELSRIYLETGVDEVRERSEAWLEGDTAVSLRIAEMDLNGLGWEPLRRFIEIAETQTPPWRLTNVNLRAGLEGLEGKLVWESLE